MRGRGGLAPLIITTVGVAILVGLGTWQMQRRAWKAEMITAMRERLSEPPTFLPDRIDDPEAWRYRPVIVTGRLLTDANTLVLGRPKEGRAGYDLYTPLVPNDGAPPVFIDRGWVPLDWAGPDMPPATAIVIGLALPPRGKALGQGDNTDAAPGRPRVWNWPDLPAMAKAVGLETPAPVIIQRFRASDDPPVPAPAETRVDLTDNHLQYAITWYSLALALAGVYLMWRRRPSS